MKFSLWGTNSINYECPTEKNWSTLKGSIGSLENILRQINEKMI